MTASDTPSGAVRIRVAGVVLVLAAAAHIGGCSYIEMMQRHRRLRDAFEKQPRLGLVQEFAPEQSLQVTGGLQCDLKRDDPLAIIALSQQYAHNEIVAWRIVPGSVGYYSILLPQGHYDLLVLADLNHDGVFGNDEVVGRTPPDASVAVQPSLAADGVNLDGPTLRLDCEHPAVED